MALITCKECGAQISDRAKECPHCGCPQETAESLKSKGRIRILKIAGGWILWAVALFIIVFKLCGGYFPNGRFEWFRCEMNYLILPFIIATIFLIARFLVDWKGRKNALIGAVASLVGMVLLSGIIYLFSDSYNYKKDPYSDWYLDNIILNSDSFAGNIKGTAWSAQEVRNVDVAFIFGETDVYAAVALKDGGWVHGKGTYKTEGTNIIIENLFLDFFNDLDKGVKDKVSFNGEIYNLNYGFLKNNDLEFRVKDFHRLPKSELERYEFDFDAISNVEYVPKYGEEKSVSELAEAKIREQEAQHKQELEKQRQDSIARAEFVNDFVDLSTFIVRKKADWANDAKIPEFKDNIESSLKKLGYVETDVKRGTREGEGGYFNYKIITYEKRFSDADESAPWSKVAFDDGPCGGYTVYFCNDEQKQRFIKSCNKLGYKKYTEGGETTMRIPEDRQTEEWFYFYHENGHCEVILHKDNAEICFGCI